MHNLWLSARGWDMGHVADLCWLDCTDDGYRKVVDFPDGTVREIILCPHDAEVLERGRFRGDYTGAPLPPDSKAQAWPWRVLSKVAA